MDPIEANDLERMDLWNCDDYLSICPDDVKLEIVSFLSDPQYLCAMSRVSSLWYQFITDDRIWKPLFHKDFLGWSSRACDRDITPKEGESWRSLYIEFHLKGWQWDPNQKNSRMVLSNNNFSATLSSGYTYHGVRTTRGEQTGKHYFEILIEPADDNKRFDKGNTIFMGVGIANSNFVVENCCSGWTRDNGGIGYYNDGQIFALSERYYPKNSKIAYRTNDRVGVEFDLDLGYVTFYLNGNPITERIPGAKGFVYPHVILANDIKHRVSITTGRRTPPTNTKEKEVKTIEHMEAPVYANALTVLESMGFQNREVCTDLLIRFNGDVERVVNELLV